MSRFFRLSSWLLCALLLTGCAGMRDTGDGPPRREVDLSTIEEPVPRPEPLSDYGNPAAYTVYGVTYSTLDSAAGYAATGKASWYGKKFHGRRTSSGETYDMYEYTAAHRTLPLPTYARVSNLENGRSVIVRINDRGPFAKDRLIDLSYVAALKLGYVKDGITRVKVEALTAKVPTEQAQTADTDAEPRIYLQAGAFVNQTNADALRARLRDAGIERVIIEPARLETRHFYRVRVGPLVSMNEAHSTADRIARLGFEPPAVIID